MASLTFFIPVPLVDGSTEERQRIFMAKAQILFDQFPDLKYDSHDAMYSLVFHGTLAEIEAVQAFVSSRPAEFGEPALSKPDMYSFAAEDPLEFELATQAFILFNDLGEETNEQVTQRIDQLREWFPQVIEWTRQAAPAVLINADPEIIRNVAAFLKSHPEVGEFVANERTEFAQPEISTDLNEPR